MLMMPDEQELLAQAQQSLPQVRKFLQLRDISQLSSGVLGKLKEFLNIKIKILEALFGEIESQRKNFSPHNVDKLVEDIYTQLTSNNVVDITKSKVQEILQFFVSKVIEIPPGPLPGYAEQLEELLENIVTVFAFDVEEDGETHAAIYLDSILLHHKIMPLLDEIIDTIQKLRSATGFLKSSRLDTPKQSSFLRRQIDLSSLLTGMTTTTGSQAILNLIGNASEILQSLLQSFVNRLITVRDLLSRLQKQWANLVELVDRTEKSLEEFEEVGSDLARRISNIILPKFDALMSLVSSEDTFDKVGERVEEILKYFATGKQALETLSTPITAKGVTIYEGSCKCYDGSNLVKISIENIKVGDRFMVGSLKLDDGTLLIPTTTHPVSGVSLEKEFSIGSFEVRGIDEEEGVIILDRVLEIPTGNYGAIVYRNGSKYWGHLWSIIQIFRYKVLDIFTTESLTELTNNISKMINYTLKMLDEEETRQSYYGTRQSSNWKRYKELRDQYHSQIDLDLGNKLNLLQEVKQYCEEFLLPENHQVNNLLWSIEDMGATRIKDLLFDGKYQDLFNVSINNLTSLNSLWDLLSSEIKEGLE